MGLWKTSDGVTGNPPCKVCGAPEAGILRMLVLWDDKKDFADSYNDMWQNAGGDAYCVKCNEKGKLYTSISVAQDGLVAESADAGDSKSPGDNTP